jgi:hypothetical protein
VHESTPSICDCLSLARTPPAEQTRTSFGVSERGGSVKSLSTELQEFDPFLAHCVV